MFARLFLLSRGSSSRSAESCIASWRPSAGGHIRKPVSSFPRFFFPPGRKLYSVMASLGGKPCSPIIPALPRSPFCPFNGRLHNTRCSLRGNYPPIGLACGGCHAAPEALCSCFPIFSRQFFRLRILAVIPLFRLLYPFIKPWFLQNSLWKSKGGRIEPLPLQASFFPPGHYSFFEETRAKSLSTLSSSAAPHLCSRKSWVDLRIFP